MVRKKVSPQYRKKVMMEATILEVISPCHFIVRETPNASMSHEARQFIAMEGRLDKYYSSREVMYCSVPEKDEVVVILPDGEEKWYRARVISVLETMRGPSVNCYLLDYGGRRLVHRERMYKIAEEFLSVPFQAVDFILLGIKPLVMTMDGMLNISYGPGEEWDYASKEYVENICASMEAAFIETLGFDSDGRIYGKLHINDGKNKFCLNEALLTKKYAIVNMDDCEEIQKCVSIGISDNVEHVKNPVPNVQNISVPENYTLESYLAELFDNGKLTKEDLKSLRKSLENEVECDEVEGSEIPSKSLPEAGSKACLSKQYQNVTAALMKSRSCSRISQKNVNASSNENASASNFGTRPLSNSLQSKIRNLYKKNLTASKLSSSQTSTTACSKLGVSSQSPEEKSGKLSDVSLSSCSVPFFSTDDESSRQPSTPFPKEEARHQRRQADSNYSGSLFLKNSSVSSQQKTNDQKLNSGFSSDKLHKKSFQLNVNASTDVTSLNNTNSCRYPSHATPYYKSVVSSCSLSPDNHAQRHSSSSVGSTDSITPKYFGGECPNSHASPEKDVANCISHFPTSAAAVGCVLSNESAKQPSRSTDYNSVRKKLGQRKACVLSRASLSKDSPSKSDTSSQQHGNGRDSLKKSTDSSPCSSERSLHDQVSLSGSANTVSAKHSSKSTDYTSLRQKLVRLQKCQVSSGTSVTNGSSEPLDMSHQCKSGFSSSADCKNSCSHPCENKSSPDKATMSLDCGTLSHSASSLSPKPTAAVQSLNRVAENDVCNSIKVASSVEAKQVPGTHMEQSLSSKQNGFAHTQKEALLSGQNKLPFSTECSPTNEVLPDKDNRQSLHNESLLRQFNGKKLSIDELFASCKDKGETLSVQSLSTGTFRTTSNKILQHVRKQLKKGNLQPHHQNSQQDKSILKNSPTASITNAVELETNPSPLDLPDSLAKPSQPDLPVKCKGMEPDNMQEHNVASELFSSGQEIGIYANGVEKNSSDNDSGHVTRVDVPIQPQNEGGLMLQDSSVHSSKFWTENPGCVIKSPEPHGSCEMKATDHSGKETSLGDEKSSKCNLGDDASAVKDDGSGVSEDSSGDEDCAVYRSSMYSVVQSLTQQIIDTSNGGVCGQYFKTELDFTDKSLWEMVSIPAVSIGDCVPLPVRRTEEVSFTDQIRKRLEELHFWGPSCIQSVVWPAVFRNRSFAAIAPPASGKTIAYLLPLLSMLIDGTKYKDLPASHGAIILILCSTWLKVVKLHGQCMNLLEGTNKIKVKVLYRGGGDKDQEVSLFNGCDILISTPSSFLHYLLKRATNFGRCCNIILDDGAQLIEHCKEEITSIMQELLVHIKSMKQTIAPQIGICSEKWTKGVAAFAERFLLMPVFFFTSFLEAAVYSKIPIYIHSCNSQTLDYVLLGLLDGIICPKAIVCTRDIETAKHVHSVLQTNAVFSMLVHDNKPQYELTAIKRHWNLHHRRDSTFILVITDSALLNMNIKDADCIVHYDLPELSRLSFSQRFGCFGDYFSGGPDPNQKKCLCHILVTDECKVQAPTLVKLMNRLGQKYPRQLLQLACEQKLLSNQLKGPLCKYTKAFGVCDDSHCVQRHTVIKENDAPTIVPKQGEIKAVVIKVLDASHYYVKILEYTDPVTSSTTIVSAQYTKLFMDLKNHYSQASNKTVAGNVKLCEVYGIEESPKVFYRVRVLEIISVPNERETQKVKVFFLDDGWIKEKETSELLVLPEEFQSRPQMCVEAYLSKVKTVDSCNQWTPQANMFVSKVITGKEIHATIALCLGDIIWLDPVVLKEGNSVNVLKLDRTLKLLGLALPNMDHLQHLYKACADKIDLPVITHSAEKNKKKCKPVQTVDYAFLDLGVCEDVYIPEVASPQEFFVQRCKFYDLLSILEKELCDMHKKGELKRCQSVWDGMYCIVLFPDDGKLYRAQVGGFKDAAGTEVDVFFADYGDSSTAQRSNLYVIPPKFLLLPFQAIKCELAGVSAPQGEWPEEAGDMLFDLTRYENGDLKTLTAKVFQKTSSITGGSLYTIQLFSGSLNLSECLVENGLAVTAELPELPPLPSDKHDKEQDVDFDDIPSGYISAASDDSMEPEEKEASALFYAALCGLYTPKVNECLSTTKRETAYPPASVEEVVELATSDDCDVIQDPSLPECPAANHLNSSPRSNPTNLKPNVLWWDVPREVFITIKLLGVQTYDICPFINGFSFSTDLGDKHYFVDVTFFAEVIPEKTVVDCQGQYVRITFQKKESKKWPRLTQETGKVFYIQRDFEHIDTESENEKSESPDIFIPRTPVKKEDICHMHSTTEGETSSDDGDYDSSWQRVCQPKEM